MNKRLVVRIFRREFLPPIVEREKLMGGPDYPARWEAWGILLDRLCKAGEISQDQYDTWEYPEEVKPL